MESFYQSYGIFLFLGLFILFVLMFVWMVLLHVRLTQLAHHYQTLTSNVDGENLEQLLENHLAHLYQTSLKVDDIIAYCQELDQSMRRAVQQVGIVRFNPFNDTGSDQSFAIALLDAAGNGLVLSSLYSRSGNRIFAKSIEGGQSKYPLTDEEKEAIRQATSVPMLR